MPEEWEAADPRLAPIKTIMKELMILGPSRKLPRDPSKVSLESCFTAPFAFAQWVIYFFFFKASTPPPLVDGQVTSRVSSMAPTSTVSTSSPAASPTDNAQDGSGVSASDRQKLLDLHNAERAAYGWSRLVDR